MSPLELTHTEVSDIKEKHPREPALQRYREVMFSPRKAIKLLYRQEVLRVWKSKNGLRATYKNLLGKFLTARHEAGVKAVCEVLQKKGTNSTSHYNVQSCMIVYEQELTLHACTLCILSL